jgi:hypothetical protein
MSNGTLARLLAAATIAAAVLLAFSCGDDDQEPRDDGGADDAAVDVQDEGGGADGDADADGDAGEDCDFAAPATLPEMRLRTLNVTAPDAMRNAILRGIINGAMDNESFIWLVRFTGVGTGTITLRTGSGGKVEGTDCTYRFLEPDYPAREMTCTESGLHFALSGEPIAQIGVPLWATGDSFPDPPLLTLPLRELDLSGDFSADHNYVGSYDDTTEEWTDGGLLVGKMTVEETKTVVIEDMTMTLCGLISGDTGVSSDWTDDCSRDPSTWDHPPDTTVGDEPAYNMSGTFAASPVHILD